MKTIIISRFNIHIEKFREMAKITDENFPQWCARRVELFLKTTLPSVERQTVKHYKWIIGFDTVMTPEIEALLERLKENKNIIPLIVDNRKGVTPGFIEALKKAVVDIAAGETVLTIRLDTDDVIHEEFLSRMQTTALGAYKRSIVPCGINPVYGSQISNGLLYAMVYNNNPFLGVVEEPGPDLKTAFGFSHYEIEDHMPVRQCPSSEPLWTQIVHGGNAANGVNPDLIGLVPTMKMIKALMLDEIQ